MKKSIHQEDITAVNIYIPNTETSKNILPILTDLKRERDNNTMTVVNFSTLLLGMDRSFRQKANKETF